MDYDNFRQVKRCKIKICAVIVTYNRLSILEKCIYSLEKSSVKCDLLVINNNSSDGTEEFLKQKQIEHISLDRNTGGAGGFNVGIKEAISRKYDFVWLMDDDCIVEENALEELMIADKKLQSKYGFLASKVLWVDGELHAMNKLEYKDIAENGFYEVKQATFVSLLIKADTVKRVGYPIKDFFIWGDDIEYTRRIAVRYGLKSYYVEKSVVVHETKENIGSKIAYDTYDRLEMYKFAYRNEAFLYRKEGLYGVIYYILKCIYNTFRIILFSSNNKIGRIKVLFEGIRKGIRFNPEIESYGD